jgi:hypothetical protein
LRCREGRQGVGTKQPPGPIQQVQLPPPLLLPLQQPDALLLQLLPNAIDGAMVGSIACKASTSMEIHLLHPVQERRHEGSD